MAALVSKSTGQIDPHLLWLCPVSNYLYATSRIRQNSKEQTVVSLLCCFFVWNYCNFEQRSDILEITDTFIECYIAVILYCRVSDVVAFVGRPSVRRQPVFLFFYYAHQAVM